MRQFSFIPALLAGIALAQGPAQVKIASGDIIGEFLPSGIRRWMGVPFAQSPPERFSPPSDAAAWTSPLKTTQAKPSCFGQIDCKHLLLAADVEKTDYTRSRSFT
jgi:carboxylesterase type B